jgi:hypothetical protein
MNYTIRDDIRYVQFLSDDEAEAQSRSLPTHLFVYYNPEDQSECLVLRGRIILPLFSAVWSSIEQIMNGPYIVGYYRRGESLQYSKTLNVVLDFSGINQNVVHHCTLGETRESVIELYCEALRIIMKYGCFYLRFTRSRITLTEDESEIADKLFQVLIDCQKGLDEAFSAIHTQPQTCLTTKLGLSVVTNFSDTTLENFRRIKAQKDIMYRLGDHNFIDDLTGEEQFGNALLIYEWLHEPVLSNAPKRTDLILTNFSKLIPYRLPEIVHIECDKLGKIKQLELMYLYKIQCRALRDERLVKFLSTPEHLEEIKLLLENEPGIEDGIKYRLLEKIENRLKLTDDSDGEKKLELAGDEALVINRVANRYLQKNMKVLHLFAPFTLLIHFGTGAMRTIPETDGFEKNQLFFQRIYKTYLKQPELRQLFQGLVEDTGFDKYIGFQPGPMFADNALYARQFARCYIPEYYPDKDERFHQLARSFGTTTTEQSFAFLMSYWMACNGRKRERTAEETEREEGVSVVLNTLPLEIVKSIIRVYIL